MDSDLTFIKWMAGIFAAIIAPVAVFYLTEARIRNATPVLPSVPAQSPTTTPSSDPITINKPTPSPEPTPEPDPVIHPEPIPAEPIPTPTPSSRTPIGTITGEPGSKNIRNGPGTMFDIVSTIEVGDQVSILGLDYDKGGYKWYRIRTSNGAEAWIAAQLLNAP